MLFRSHAFFKSLAPDQLLDRLFGYDLERSVKAYYIIPATEHCRKLVGTTHSPPETPCENHFFDSSDHDYHADLGDSRRM